MTDAPNPPNYLLRLSFPLLDENMLANKGTLKDIIRIVKVIINFYESFNVIWYLLLENLIF
jgi:hypothetical protein